MSATCPLILPGTAHVRESAFAHLVFGASLLVWSVKTEKKKTWVSKHSVRVGARGNDLPHRAKKRAITNL